MQFFYREETKTLLCVSSDTVDQSLMINWWNFIFDSDWQGVIEWQVEFELNLQKVHILF